MGQNDCIALASVQRLGRSSNFRLAPSDWSYMNLNERGERLIKTIGLSPGLAQKLPMHDRRNEDLAEKLL